METVSIENVQPGQVIAQAVTGVEGVVLCPHGLRLTQALIDRLKRLGVNAVVLETTGGEQSRLLQRLAELELRFRDVDDPILLQIKATIETRLQSMLMALGD